MEVKQAPLRGAWPSTPAIAIDQTLRRGRIVEARRLALETSRALQAKYRQALVLEIEGELCQRKAAWEASRAARLAALQALYARSLVMVGEAQKAAVVEAAADLSAAAAQVSPWGALATATVRRGLAAAAAEDSAHFQTLRAGDAAVYRSEVTRAAAVEERARVQGSSSGSLRRPRGGSLGSSSSSASRRPSMLASSPSAPTHPLVPQGTPPATALPPRLSPFYGPRAAAGLAATVDAGTGRAVVGGIPRVPVSGPLACAPPSAARVAFVAERGDGEDRGRAGAAAAAGAAALAAAREAAGAAAAGARAAASRRGSAASAAVREPREALAALAAMDTLVRERRASSARSSVTGSSSSCSSSGWRGGVMPSARGGRRSRSASVGSLGWAGGRDEEHAPADEHSRGYEGGQQPGYRAEVGGEEEEEEEEEEVEVEQRDEAALESAFLAALVSPSQ